MIKSIKSWVRRSWINLLGLTIIGLFLTIVLYNRIVHTIEPGHVGVTWYRFFDGTDTSPEGVLSEGIHLIFPWDRIYIYDARLRTTDIEVEGLSSDGLNISVNFIVRYTIAADKVGFLHKSIGPDYEKILIRPQLRELALSYLSKNQASDLYSDRRSRVQKSIEAMFSEAMKGVESNTKFTDYYIKTEDVLMAHVKLPGFVARAIEEKEKVRHINESYEFRLMLEDKERRRKRLEAEGVRSFQEIIGPGITESYLRWRGIQATLELAKSQNTKIVIIGDKDGLPLILNTESDGKMFQTPEKSSMIPKNSKLPASEPFQGGEPFQVEVESTKIAPSPPLETEEMVEAQSNTTVPFAVQGKQKKEPEGAKEMRIEPKSRAENFLDRYKLKIN